jgi:ADP-heptose:LPS heptosyltransferase
VKVHAIRLGRFGDLVLLLPALTLLKARQPESHLTLLTDTRWAPLARMCPAIDEVIGVDRVEMRDGSPWRAVGRIVRLISDVRRHRFDAVIDFHGFRETSLIAWWSKAPQRWGLKRFDQSFLAFCFNRPPIVEDKSLHASESFLRLVRSFAPGATSTPAREPLAIPSDALRWAEANLPSSPFVVLFTDAPVPERIWPLARFASLAEEIARKRGGSVVVVAKNKDEAMKEWPAGVHVFAGLSIPQLCAVISKARMLVSNDTGPMHLGPAFNVPTVGIFSVGIPVHFRPTGAADRVVQGNPIETVSVGEVLSAVDQVWQPSDLRDLRR